MPFFGQRQQRLGEQMQLLDPDGKLAGLGTEQVAADADRIAQVQQVEQFETALADGVLPHIDLYTAAVSLQVSKTGLAHQPVGNHTPGYADFAPGRLQILRSGFAEGIRERARGIRPAKFAGIGIVTECPNLIEFFLPLLKLVARLEFQCEVLSSWLPASITAAHIPRNKTACNANAFWYTSRVAGYPLMRFHRAQSDRVNTVQSDWRASLPEAKNEVYGQYVHELEAAYAMLSISLDEAIGLRHEARLLQAGQQVCMTASLCARLTTLLEALYRSIAGHARHYGTVPNVLPLDAANFKSSLGHRAAKMSGLISSLLLTQRSQFIHKNTTLLGVVVDLGNEYRAAAEELASGTSIEPATSWRIIDEVHYDLNTCMCEVIVLLKSFFLVLPDDELLSFTESVSACLKARPLRHAASVPRIRNGRMAPIGGE